MEINIKLPKIKLVSEINTDKEIENIIEEIIKNYDIDVMKENIKKVKDKRYGCYI
jgi:hypothetical protein